MSDFKTLADVGGFLKGGERVQFRIVQAGERRLLDARTFYQTDGGLWKATRRGVAIPEDLLEELRININALCDTAIQMREKNL